MKKRQHGLALIVALLIVTIMVILIGAVLAVLQTELGDVAHRGYENRALYIADAGVQGFLVDVDENVGKSINPDATMTYRFAPEAGGRQAYYSWTMLDSGSNYNGLLYYAVRSDGYVPQGGAYDHRQVIALLQQGAFSNYNYFGKNNAPGNYFVSGLMQFNGPVYLEGRSASTTVNLQWYKDTAPIFLDRTIISGNYTWWGPGHSRDAQPQSTSEWNTVNAQGKNGVKFRSRDFVPFPPETSNTLVANESWSGRPVTSGFPSPAPGVYVNQQLAANPDCSGPVHTGLYVQGDAKIVMTSSPAGTVPSKQIFSLTPTGQSGSIPNAVTITVDYTNDRTTVTQGSNTKYCAGHLGGSGGSGGVGANGSIFVNGNVKALSGMVNGQYTLGVPDTAALSKNIVVTGHIRYHNDPKTCACDSKDLLGIFANNVQVDPSIAPNDLIIEAAVFAGNKTEVSDNRADGSFQTTLGSGGGVCGGGVPLKNNLTVYGSLVNNYISPLGCFDARTGKLTHGYADQYTFDTRLKTLVPPFWPRTANFNIVAWRDLGI